MLPIYQSAYRNHHSTEIASVKVLNDLLLAVDKYNEAVLILLDYTAAFDTIDYTSFTSAEDYCRLCITLKVLLLTYKIIQGQAPIYLSDLIYLRCSSSLRPLQSSPTLQLTIRPRTTTRSSFFSNCP